MILFSVSVEPSQWAEINPPLFFKTSLNSSNESTLVVFSNLNLLALKNKLCWISSKTLGIFSSIESIEIILLEKSSLLESSTVLFSKS